MEEKMLSPRLVAAREEDGEEIIDGTTMALTIASARLAASSRG